MTAVRGPGGLAPASVGAGRATPGLGVLGRLGAGRRPPARPAVPPPAGAPPPARRRPGARAGVYGVLDLGSTKVVCLIARVEADGEPRVLGFGWQRARGMRRGSIASLDEAEAAIRRAVGQAEEMAGAQIAGALVNLSCGQPGSRHLQVQWPVGGRAVTAADLRAILAESRKGTTAAGREVVQAVALGFGADATPGIADPRGMPCDTLSARLHLVEAAPAALRTVGACLLRCDLEVEEMVPAAFAAGLAVLTDDERHLGATVVDLGGGTTTLAAFAEGRLLHTAHLAVGAGHVTDDLAVGLDTPVEGAERLKVLYGAVQAALDDEHEWLSVPQLGEEDHRPAPVSRARVIEIIRPRLEETLELVRDRLDAAALGPAAGGRVVLTGGGSLLVGVRDLAAEVLGRPVRIGRPHPVRGLPEMAGGPAFATALGLLAWGAGVGRPALDLAPVAAPAAAGGLRRIVAWLRARA